MRPLMPNLPDVTASRRRSWPRILAITVGVLVVVGLLATGGSIYWWQSIVTAHSAEIQAARRDGDKAGPHADYQGCLDQASARITTLTGGVALAVGTPFLFACLDAATEPPGFCDVPSSISGMRSWTAPRCANQPPDAKASCELLVGSVREFCKARNAKTR